MGSSHFGDLSLESRRSGPSKRGKKNSLGKPKQPQRGLGVAQLEIIRLKNQMGDGYLPTVQGPFQNNLCKVFIYSIYDNQMGGGYLPTVQGPFQNNLCTVGATVEIMGPLSSSFSDSSSSQFGPIHPNIMMGFEDLERREIRFGDLQSGITASNSSIDSLNFVERTVALPLLGEPLKDLVKKKRRQDRRNSIGTSSQTSESSVEQDPDLDLKLSL